MQKLARPNLCRIADLPAETQKKILTDAANGGILLYGRMFTTPGTPARTDSTQHPYHYVENASDTRYMDWMIQLTYAFAYELLIKGRLSYATSAMYKALAEDGTTHPLSLDSLTPAVDQIYVTSEDVEKIKSPSNQNEEINPRAETTYLNIIGCLLELMLGKSPSGKSQSVFKDQSAIITAMEANYPQKQGIKKRTLEKKFSEAKQHLKGS